MCKNLFVYYALRINSHFGAWKSWLQKNGVSLLIELFIAAYKWKFTLHWFSLQWWFNTWLLKRTQERTAYHINSWNSSMFKFSNLLRQSLNLTFLHSWLHFKIKHLKGHLGNDSSELPPEIYWGLLLSFQTWFKLMTKFIRCQTPLKESYIKSRKYILYHLVARKN